MSQLLFMNDVSTELEEANLMPGDDDPPASALGNKQADEIVPYFYTKVKRIDVLFSSDATRILKLVHKLRLQSKDNRIASNDIRKLKGLRERSLGVLNRSLIPWNSDIFCHSRVLAEEGESILQCRSRLMKCITSICYGHMDKRILLVSHPLLCQIAMNAILHKGHTLHTEFWQKKGSFIIFDFSRGRYGIKWGFHAAFNTFEDSAYSTEDIYHRLLSEARTRTSPSP